MEKSYRGPTLNEIMAENGALKKTLQNATSMLALICYTQGDKPEDRFIDVSVEELAKLPVGSYIDVTFRKESQSYRLQWQPADAPDLPGVEIKPSLVVT
jgi:hypothetical protein